MQVNKKCQRMAADLILNLLTLDTTYIVPEVLDLRKLQNDLIHIFHVVSRREICMIMHRTTKNNKNILQLYIQGQEQNWDSNIIQEIYCATIKKNKQQSYLMRHNPNL